MPDTDELTEVRRVARGDSFFNPDPSPAYDGYDTPEAMDARYKELVAAAVANHCPDYPPALPIKVLDPLMEDHRRAWCRWYRERDGRNAPTRRTNGKATATRVKRQDAVGRTVVAEVAATDTLVCVECGEDKPVTKFPTLSKRPGVRETTCRECKKR